MDGRDKQTTVYPDNTRRSVSVHRDVQRTRASKPNDYKQNNGNNKRNRHNKYFLPVVLCLTSITNAQLAVAETVGGVSATADPIANSSGSVTNQAIQVLQGPYITNQYGDGITCQGSTLNITPYVTGSASAAKPYEGWYDTPVYDMRDLDEDGAPDNPGAILWNQPTRTGQKDNYSLGVGFSATWSIPLNKKQQKLCEEAVIKHNAMREQVLANKRLDFEIARLKNCGELLQKGIRFAPGTKYATICADVQVVAPPSQVQPHVHSIPTSSSKNAATSDVHIHSQP